MSRKHTMPEPWAALVTALGSVQAVASALDCDTRTLRRWAHKEVAPTRTSCQSIRALFRGNNLPVPAL